MPTQFKAQNVINGPFWNSHKYMENSQTGFCESVETSDALYEYKLTESFVSEYFTQQTS